MNWIQSRVVYISLVKQIATCLLEKRQCMCFHHAQCSWLLMIFLSLRISVCVSSMAIGIEKLFCILCCITADAPSYLFVIGWGMYCIVWEGWGCGWRQCLSSELPWDQCLGSYLLMRSTVWCLLPLFGTGLWRNCKIFIVGPCLL